MFAPRGKSHYFKVMESGRQRDSISEEHCLLEMYHRHIRNKPILNNSRIEKQREIFYFNVINEEMAFLEKLFSSVLTNAANINMQIKHCNACMYCLKVLRKAIAMLVVIIM